MMPVSSFLGCLSMSGRRRRGFTWRQFLWKIQKWVQHKKKNPWSHGSSRDSFGTSDWIRTSGLQSRSYQAVNAGALMPQGFQWFRTNTEGKWSKPGSHCGAMAPGFFRIFQNSSQIVVKVLAHSVSMSSIHCSRTCSRGSVSNTESTIA